MIRSSSRASGAFAARLLLVAALAATGCTSRHERAVQDRLENANDLIEQADQAATRCRDARVGLAQADQNVISNAGEARIASADCGRSAALNQQASAALNSAGTP